MVSRSARRLRSLVAVLTIFLMALSCEPATAQEKLEIPRANTPSRLDPGPELTDFEYACGSTRCNRADFMRQVRVCALLAMKGRQLRLWAYNGDRQVCDDRSDPSAENGPAQLYGIASVTKSITSTLLGFALMRTPMAPEDGIDFSKLDEPVTAELPELDKGPKGAFTGVPVERTLLMRSGAAFKEDGQDARNLRGVFGVKNKTARAYLKTLRRVTRWFKPIGPNDGEFNYSGADTQVIGLLTARLAQPDLHQYIWNKLWDPLGMESRAKWQADDETPKMMSAFCCFNATAPDLLRFGKFVLDRGRNLDGKQLLPAEWFDRATRSVPGVKDEIPRNNISYNDVCGPVAPTKYRYQWWLFEGRTDFTAVGIEGQYIHIYPDEDLVIVQISDWADWDDALACESMAAHAAIAAALRN